MGSSFTTDYRMKVIQKMKVACDLLQALLQYSIYMRSTKTGLSLENGLKFTARCHSK